LEWSSSKKEQAAEFKGNIANLLDRFKAKSRRWTARYRRE
jgi:hypothetical protein